MRMRDKFTVDDARYAARLRSKGNPIARIARLMHIKPETVERMLFDFDDARDPGCDRLVIGAGAEILESLVDNIRRDPIAADDAYVAAVQRAIDSGAERAPIGIDTRPGTRAPRRMNASCAAGGSSAQACVEHG